MLQDIAVVVVVVAVVVVVVVVVVAAYRGFAGRVVCLFFIRHRGQDERPMYLQVFWCN